MDFDTRIFTIGVDFFVCQLRDESPTCGLFYMRVCDQSGLFVVILERVQTMVICMHIELGKSSVWTFCLYRIGKSPPYGLKCAHIYHQNGHFVWQLRDTNFFMRNWIVSKFLISFLFLGYVAFDVLFIILILLMHMKFVWFTIKKWVYCSIDLWDLK